jgi:hypothetical protein
LDFIQQKHSLVDVKSTRKSFHCKVRRTNEVLAFEYRNLSHNPNTLIYSWNIAYWTLKNSPLKSFPFKARSKNVVLALSILIYPG